jgi:Fe-S oxidoreductase
MATFRESNIAKTTIELLNKLNVDFTMLGSNEWCCGSVMLRSGNISVAQEMIEHNVTAINQLGADTVITSCAGCYRTIKQDYPKFVDNLGFVVKHLPEYLLEFIEKEEVNFKSNIFPEETKVTYHDPCHLGRHMGIYEPPRKVIQSIDGLELVEMQRSRENARCCGSGGGVSSAYKSLSNDMADARIEDALKTDADILTSACPFCTYALKTAAERIGKAMDAELKLEVMDFSELISKVVE